MYKVTKLNRKYTGYEHFQYIVTVERPKNNRFLDFQEIKQEWFELREWCWTTWGPSKEIEDWLKATMIDPTTHVSQNTHWCWQNDKYATRIYLTSDKELNWFTLRWSQNLVKKS